MTLALYDVFGNRLLVALSRTADPELRESHPLGRLCFRGGRRIADGIALFSRRPRFFRTAFYNPDGSFERLCGNSLLVAAAALVETGEAATILPFGLPAIELFHTREYLEARSVIELAPHAVELVGVGSVPVYDTGSPHAVVGVNGGALELDSAASAFVRDANVNLTLVRTAGDALHARTFERGVGAETAACGTGALAAAMAAERFDDWIDVRYGKRRYRIRICRAGGKLAWTLRAERAAVELVERDSCAHDDGGPSSVSGSSSTRCST
jgi:diaminopimelate epimerase